MALGGITGAWTPNAPSDTSNVGLGASDIRSLKTNVQEPLDSEHIFSSAGGAGMGAHRAGSGRVFYDTASRVSSTDTDGRVMITSDTSRLFNVSSATTQMLGSQYALVHFPRTNQVGSFQTSLATQFWGCEYNLARILSGSNNTTFTLSRAYLSTAFGVANPQVSGSSLVVYGTVVGTTTATITRYVNSAASNAPANEDVAFFVVGRAALTST